MTPRDDLDLVPGEDEHYMPAWQRELDAAAVRVARAKLEQQRLRQNRIRRRRRLVAGAAAVIASGIGIASVAGAGLQFLGNGGSEGSGTRPPRDTEPAPGWLQLKEARAADPVGGPPWGVRTYPDRGGGTCAIVGRVVRGRVGKVLNGQFVQYDPTVQGGCAVLPVDHFLGTTEVHPEVEGGRSALFGLTDFLVSRVAISGGGRTTEIPREPDGSFLLVRRGCQAFRGQTLTVVVDGVVHERPLQVISEPCD